MTILEQYGQQYWPSLCAELMLENLQLRAALGQSVPSWVPGGSIKCGMCEARNQPQPPQRLYNKHDTALAEYK